MKNNSLFFFFYLCCFQLDTKQLCRTSSNAAFHKNKNISVWVQTISKLILLHTNLSLSPPKKEANHSTATYQSQFFLVRVIRMWSLWKSIKGTKYRRNIGATKKFSSYYSMFFNYLFAYINDTFPLFNIVIIYDLQSCFLAWYRRWIVRAMNSYKKVKATVNYTYNTDSNKKE